MNILVVDDIRVLKDIYSESQDVTYARHPDTAIEILTERGGEFDIILLDHDMGIDFNTGKDITVSDVVDHMVENWDSVFKESDPWVIVHTSNGYAGDWMMKALAGFDVIRAFAGEFFDKEIDPVGEYIKSK